MARTKSSPFFGVALQLGALVGASSVETAERIRELGCLYGEMIQIYDDMHDSMEAPANPDQLQGRSPLPILFASLVNHPERWHFLELKKNIDQSSALKDAQEIIIQCGAISYCADQLVRRNQKAMGILGRIALGNPQPVSNLFEKVIAHIDKLLETFDL